MPAPGAVLMCFAWWLFCSPLTHIAGITGFSSKLMLGLDQRNGEAFSYSSLGWGHADCKGCPVQSLLRGCAHPIPPPPP